tara:strand:- start:340 stop:567 length:228 start_codon:yes stop_codon:yes gene_type:complete
MSKLKEKATKYIEKGKEQLDKIPSNPVTKTTMSFGKKLGGYIKKNPADATLALGVSLITFDIDRIADTIDDPTQF